MGIGSAGALKQSVVDESQDDGRDEMNLAEFPLGLLADRASPGQKTLVFADRVFDEGRGEFVARRLTISASDKYGLPTALDDEVILGLIQLSKETRFAGRSVSFSRYRLLELLGWRDEGRSYHRLETSLRRWLGVTLYYDKAWWDKTAQSWADESFHILEHVTIRRRDNVTKEAPMASCLSSFTWNEVVFRSFQAGYLKALDWNTFRRLKLPTTKRIYRFLDKRFYHKSAWEFDLFEFAFEHVGLSRAYDTGQVKRKLMPAVKELEDVRFLEPLPKERRFVRKGRGDWRIVVGQSRNGTGTKQFDSEGTTAINLLVERGVSERAATKLVATSGAAQVVSQVADFDDLLKRGNHGALRNPPGFLVAAVRGGFRLRPTNDPLARKAKGFERTNAVRNESNGDGSYKRVVDYLARLSEHEHAELEARALAAAEPFMRKNYERVLASGQQTLATHYREGIVIRFVTKNLVANRDHRHSADEAVEPVESLRTQVTRRGELVDA